MLLSLAFSDTQTYKAIDQKIARLIKDEKSEWISEDAISREWAINKQKELIELYTPHKTVEGRGQVYWQIEERKLVAKELEQAPSVIPKPKEEETPTCSECDHYEDHHTSLACANCPVITKVWGGKENE